MVRHALEQTIVFCPDGELDPNLAEAIAPIGPVRAESLPPNADQACIRIEEAATLPSPPRVIVLPETESNVVLCGRVAASADVTLVVNVREIVGDGPTIRVRTGGGRAALLDEWELPADRPALLSVKTALAWDDPPQIAVSVGGGAADAEALAVIREVATRLGADLTCSRPVVEAGLLPATHLVGVSGATVRPDAYLMFGIGGADPHLAGVRARSVAVINQDPEAYVFRIADEGVAADAKLVGEALLAAW